MHFRPPPNSAVQRKRERERERKRNSISGGIIIERVNVEQSSFPAGTRQSLELSTSKLRRVSSLFAAERSVLFGVISVRCVGVKIRIGRHRGKYTYFVLYGPISFVSLS